MRLALFILLLSMAAPAAFGGTTYYVDAALGNNSNPGTAGSPFLTIQRAATAMVAGDLCIVKTGTYREQVTPTNNHVTFRAAAGETVVVSAFEHVTGWTVHSNNIYRVDLAWDDLGDNNQVIYNQQMMNLARWPNKTNFNPFDIQAARSTSGTNSSISQSGIPALNWANGGVVWYLGRNRWTSWRQPITGSAAGVVNFNTLPTGWEHSNHSPTAGGEVILMNILEALDSPGEWYVDRAANRVYLQTPNGEDPDAGTALVRRRTNVFNLSGRTGVRLHGLQIEGGNVDLRGANSCIVENCRIRFGNHTIASTSAAFVGQSSITLNGSSLNNIIRKNDIQWGASSGIGIGGTNNLITNNHIGNFNYLGSYSAPVELGGTNDLTRNRIFNGGRDLIRGGGSGSDISYNELHHSSLINDDCGAIYFCCNTFNFTRIHHNWIHDCSSRDNNFVSYKSAGIYLDNSSMQVIVDHNVIWNVEWSCLQINWAGTDLLMFNNTLWSNSGPNSKSMDRWANGYTFTNVPVWNTLANQGTYHSTDLSNTCTLPLTADPFEDFSNQSFTPMAGTCPVDAGTVVAPYTDGYLGSAPDIGAYERGAIPWVAGTDWALDTALNADDGTWNGITGNWSDASDPGGVWSGGTPASFTDSTAFFTGVDIAADRVITLDAARTIGNITFTDATTPSHNLTISGANILTLDRTTGVPVIDVTQAGRTLTIASQISGADGLQKNGTGTLRLSGPNNYTGTTVINGPLTLSHDNALGSTAVGSHTTIAATGLSTGPKLTVSSGITTAENITITGATETVNFAEVLAGSGTLSGNVTLASPTGAIRLGGVTIAGTITQTGTNRTLVLNGTTINNAISNNGGAVQVYGGGATLKGVSGSGIGKTSIDQNGVLRLGVTNALNTANDLTIGSFNTDNGTFDLAGYNQTIRGLTSGSTGTARKVINSVASTTSTLTVGNGTGTFNFSGAILDNNGTGGAVALVKIGSSTQTLSGTNTYTGPTTISAGTLALGAGNALPDASALTIGAAMLHATTAGTEVAGTLAVSAAATIQLAPSAKIEFLASNALAWPGTLNITGSFVSGVSLRFGNNASGLSTTQLAKISVPGYTGFGLNSNGYLTASVSGPGNTAPVANALSPTTAEDTALNITLSATDAEGDPLTYSIVTPPASGTLSGTAPDLIYTPATNFHGPASFTFRANDGMLDSAIATVSITITPVNDAPAFAANPIIGANATQDMPYTGTLAGSASDVDAGATLTYAKVNGASWLSIASNGALSGTPTSSNAGLNQFTVSVSDGIAPAVQATLHITVPTPGNLYSSGAKTWNSITANWGLATGGPYNTATWSSGNSAILEGTAGTVTLGEAIPIKNLTFTNTAGLYNITGSTLNFTAGTITAPNPSATGTLGARIESNITGAPAINMFSVAGDRWFTLKPAAGGSMSIGAVTGNGGNGSAKLVLEGGAGSTGTIASSSGPKVIVTAGSWTLSGASTGRDHSISGGTLTLNANLTSTARAVILSGTGVLNYNLAGAVSATAATNTSTDNGFRITGGTLDQTSGAAINTNSSTTHIDLGGNLTFLGSNGANSNLHLGSGVVWLKDGNRQITVTNAATTLTIGGVIQNDDTLGRSLTKAGAGTLSLSAANTYTGPTIVSTGTLRINGSTSASSVVTVNGGDLGGIGTIGGNVTIAAAGNLAPGVTAGTLNITGNLDLSAMASGAGTLKFGLNALAGTNDRVAVGGSLSLGTLALDDLAVTNLGGLQAGTYTLITSTALTGTVSGSTALIASGFNGRLQINGNNLELVVTVSTPPATFPPVGYAAWAEGRGAFDADDNGDGVANGTAWLLGAADPSENALNKLPAVTHTGTHLRLTFSCLKSTLRGGAQLKVQCSTDCGITDPWSNTEAVVPDADKTENGVIFYTTDDGDYIKVLADIPLGGAHLFVRLSAVNPE
jgi:autotransporter-associated beta strand protein